MADVKISALTNIASGALASGDKFPVADASDLSASYHATAGNIKTFVNTAPVFAAGSASAHGAQVAQRGARSGVMMRVLRMRIAESIIFTLWDSVPRAKPAPCGLCCV